MTDTTARISIREIEQCIDDSGTSVVLDMIEEVCLLKYRDSPDSKEGKMYKKIAALLNHMTMTDIPEILNDLKLYL